MRAVIGLFVLFISILNPAIGTADTPAVGQAWILVERDLGIPAHPGPGNNAVSHRYESNARVAITQIDSQTGWLKVVDASNLEGWITSRYLGSLVGSDDQLTVLDWCPPKSKPDLGVPHRLRIASWNLGNLHSENDKSIYTGSRPSVKRRDIDYERIKCYVRMFDPDILAVQEVDGEAALSRIVDTDVYNINVSDRPKGNLGGQQNTGFAWKKSIVATPRPDYDELDFNEQKRLRYGARLDVVHQGETIEMMSVHLKSGCFTNAEQDDNKPACQTLEAQIPKLEQWIDDRSSSGTHFVILGDFNRRFNLPDDRVWIDIDDSEPSNSNLKTVTEDKPVSCRDNKYISFIDHIVVPNHTLPFLDESSFRQVTYRQDDEDVWDKISDHCPIVVEMWITN